VLAQAGIQTVEFWNNGDPVLRHEKSHAAFLRRHLLEVPIHQDVGPEGIDYMARQILDHQIGMAA
jgi:hypothetical protein